MRISTNIFDVTKATVISKGLLSDGSTETTDIEIETPDGDYRIVLFHDDPLVISHQSRHPKENDES